VRIDACKKVGEAISPEGTLKNGGEFAVSIRNVLLFLLGIHFL